VPSLLVAGEDSGRIDDATFAEIKARSASVELATVRDSNHHVTLDNPRGFVEAVRRFLTK
jgi:pimeloyl-ACP methyl ester carboxylesterase